ncbi:capsular polysaccharide synthesis protein [Gracilibacillus sp. Marseille-QA3620]
MSKIKKVINILKQDVFLIKNFGFKIAAIDFARGLVFRGTGKWGRKLEWYKHENIKKYLLLKYGHIVNLYEDLDVDNLPQIESDSPVWVFWWQGLEHAPSTVKKCVASIQQNAGAHCVNIITKHNYKNYVTLPDYILYKYEKGDMTITHFSDILRMELLYTHGGIWMDATLYLTEELPSDLNEYRFYTIKHGLFGDYHVCKGLWTGFFIASGKGNRAIKYFRDMFYEYWKNENQLICYLLIDCIIAIGYENIPAIYKLIEAVPKNNTQVFELANILSNEYSSEMFDYLKSDTTIYKLTYRKQFKKTIEEKETFYGYIMSK